VFAYILVFKALAKVAGQKAGVLVLLDIIFPVLFAFLIFSEILEPSVMLGGLLIVSGFFMSALQKRKS